MLDKIPRAAFFVDGSNFYHACVGAGALMRTVDYYDIDFQKLAKHLAGPNPNIFHCPRCGEKILAFSRRNSTRSSRLPEY